MSHLTTGKVRLLNALVLSQLLKKRQWKSVTVEQHINPYSKETVKSATEFQDAHGKVKCVLDENRQPHVDAFYMGTEFIKFLQDYQEECIKVNVQDLFGVSVQVSQTKMGERVIVVEYEEGF